MAYDYDLVVLGCGPAGEKGAVQAGYFGKRVAVIERAPQPGGAGVHTGTLPSKTLRETALALSGHRQRDLYGLKVELDPTQAVPRLLSRKEVVRKLEVARILWNVDRHSVDFVRGSASFIDPHTIRVTSPDGERRITSQVFLVATGSRPFQPKEIDFDDVDIDDSDSILQIDRLPTSLTILGAGVIGCEYACVFASLGVKVSLVESKGRLLPFLDLEIADRLREAMLELGIDLHLGVSYSGVRREAGRGIVTALASGPEIVSEKLLFAAGRSGATSGLGLNEIGVKTNSRGQVAVDGNYRTEVPHIYAAGDVIGFPALASTSMEQARVAVCHAFGWSYKKQVSELLPYGIYTIPEIGAVGVGEEDALVRGRPYAVGRGLYRDNARGKIIGDKEGIIKLLFDKETRKLIGCHCLGGRATELVHIGQTAIMLGGTVDTFIDMVFNYPTLSDCFKYAAYDALGKLSSGAPRLATSPPPVAVESL
jgi:NAD(P) transhydrogenase